MSGSAYTGAKAVFFATNAVAFLVGWMGLGMGIYSDVDGTSVYAAALCKSTFENRASLMIWASLSAVVAAIVGCAGIAAVKESRFLIWYSVVYTLFLLIVFTVDTAGDYANEDEELRRNLKYSTRFYVNSSNISPYQESSEAWDWLQHTRQCCGVDDYQDWSENPFLQLSNKSVPTTCCDWTADRAACEARPDGAELPGCFDRIKEDFLEHRHIALGVLVADISIWGLNLITGLVVAIWSSRIS